MDWAYYRNMLYGDNKDVIGRQTVREDNWGGWMMLNCAREGGQGIWTEQNGHLSWVKPTTNQRVIGLKRKKGEEEEDGA